MSRTPHTSATATTSPVVSAPQPARANSGVAPTDAAGLRVLLSPGACQAPAGDRGRRRLGFTQAEGFRAVGSLLRDEACCSAGGRDRPSLYPHTLRAAAPASPSSYPIAASQSAASGGGAEAISLRGAA